MIKNTEISERVSQMLEILNVNPNEFAKKLEYKRSQTVYDIINAKSAPSYDFLNRLFNSEYSELINPIWLLTGDGEMFTSGSDNKDGLNETKIQLVIELQKTKKDQVLKLIFGEKDAKIFDK